MKNSLFIENAWGFGSGAALNENCYLHAIRKETDGRCSIENTAFNIAAQSGGQRIADRRCQ